MLIGNFAKKILMIVANFMIIWYLMNLHFPNGQKKVEELKIKFVTLYVTAVCERMMQKWKMKASLITHPVRESFIKQRGI